MSQVNWLEVLGWSTQEIEDLRITGYSYIRQGSYHIALTLFEGIVVLAPPTPYDLQTLGALHLQLGNPLVALEFLDRALKADPSHLPTQLNRAKALLALGYKTQGLSQATALETSPDLMLQNQARALLLAASR